MNEQIELETVWHGALWKQFYAPKPAPPLPDEKLSSRSICATHVQRILTMLEQRALTIRGLAAATGITRSAVQCTVQYLRRQGSIGVVGTCREGKQGRSSAVYRVMG